MSGAQAQLTLDNRGEDAPGPLTASPLRIAIFNVKYSPNLGDGLLSECLEAELRKQLAGAQIETIDLAGRLAYGPGRTSRTLALSVLQAAPLPLRQAASRYVLGSVLNGKLSETGATNCAAWMPQLSAAETFSATPISTSPSNCRAAAAAARAEGAPVGVYAVGVSDNWTRQGAAMFRQALGAAPLFFASVRDARSAEIWRRRLEPSFAPAPRVVLDPGLLASEHFPAPPRAPRSTPVVGVGVMHPVSVRYHADQAQASAGKQRRWLLDLVAACQAEGWSVRVFTNGSPEDEAFLKTLSPALAAHARRRAGACRTAIQKPAELARFASGLDLMYAHRLHANIVAYSYAVPHIGFAWDKKLESFLALVGRGDYLLSVGADAVSESVALGQRALKEGVERAARAAILEPRAR